MPEPRQDVDIAELAGAVAAPSDAQRQAIDHGDGSLLVLGAAGTGKTELIARRVARLAAEGTGPEQVLVVASSPATAHRLRERTELLLDMPFEELWIGTWEEICERLLRDHAAEAGLDPFFETVGPAERLAMLLDRIDELPLRHHEIRGNPAGLLARLLRRIDALKDEAVSPQTLAAWAAECAGRARDEASREASRREREFATLYAEHDRIMTAADSLDSGDVVLAFGRLLAERADVRREIAGRFRHLMVDELEDATLARWALLAELGSDTSNLLCTLDDDAACRGPGPRAAAWFRDLHPEADVVVLDRSFRGGQDVADASRAVVSGIEDRLEKPSRAGE